MEEKPVSQLAREMLDNQLPTARQWLKGNEEDDYCTRRCIWGALRREIGTYGLIYGDGFRVANALAEVIKEQYPLERYTLPGEAMGDVVHIPGVVIARFNDHDDTHYADVRAVLEKVAAQEG
jgi:hypothetical protein